jgi:HAE1 family hydrophobic/amphiphilic exporter-1
MNSNRMEKIKFFLALSALVLGTVIPVQASEAKKEVLVLSLERALNLALEKNKDILKAREYGNQVKGRYTEEWAAALPQFVIWS